MAKKAIALIEIEGGKQIGRFTRLDLEQYLFGHHEFRLQLPIETIEGEGSYVFSQSKELIGKQITISLESDQLDDTQSPPFVGIITDVRFIRTTGSGNDLLLIGKGATVLLDNGHNYRSFEEKSLADIVEAVLSEYPANILAHQCQPAFTDTIPYMTQYRESNFNFLQRIADRFGEWCYYNGSELQFGTPEWPKAVPLLLSRDLYEFQLRLMLQPTAYQAQYYDYFKSEVYQSSAADFQANHIDAAYGEPAFNESARIFSAAPSKPWENPAISQSALDKQIERQVDQKASDMVYLDATGDHIGIGIGVCVAISGAKSEDQLQGIEDFGEFIVVQVRHYIGGDGDYRNSFRAIPKEAGVPPPNPLVTIPRVEPEPAIVKENIDPDKLGRVRVKLYWQKEGDLTPWIRLVSSHGGAAGGFFVIPEKGDEVMVAYEHYHPDRPIVLGSVYNKDNKPSGSWSDNENNIKAIKTKSGNEIILFDKGGEEAIKILNKGGTHSIILTMAEGGSISITTTNQMNLTGKNITINAEETINMIAKNVLISTEEDTVISATKNIFTHSDESTVIAAKSDAVVQSENATLSLVAKTDAALVAETGSLAAQGKTDVALASETAAVGIQGKTNVDIVADGQATVSSKAMTNVSSNGPVVVSGTLVQLN